MFEFTVTCSRYGVLADLHSNVRYEVQW